jgi:hypothetical protein
MEGTHNPSPGFERQGIWRCKDCGLLHYICHLCGMERTIVKDNDGVFGGEEYAIYTLNMRARFRGVNRPICDACWPKFRNYKWPIARPLAPSETRVSVYYNANRFVQQS